MHEVLQKLRDELAGGIHGLSAEQAQARPAPTKWSIQQIVEHLLLSYAATRDVVMVRVGTGEPTKASPSVTQRLGQLMIVTSGIFPPRRLAPPLVTPPEVPLRKLDAGELTEALDESLHGMDDALRKAESLFGSSQRSISHIILGPMSVSQWQRFHLVHGRHHLKQIVAIRSIPSN
jgi:hypothetical protein